MSYYNNNPRSNTPSHLKTGIGAPSIFRSADCIQKALAGEEHPPVNTSHGSRGKSLQATHPYTFAALRKAETEKMDREIALKESRLTAATQTASTMGAR